MIRIWTALVVLIAWANSAFAADVLPAEIAPYIDEQTVVVARIDLDRIDLENVFKIAIKMGVEEKEVVAPKQQAAAMLAELRKAGVGLVYVTINMADITQNPVCLILPLAANANAPKVIEMLEKIDGSKKLTYEAKGNVVFGASAAVLTRLKTMKPAVRDELAAALSAGKNSAIHITFALTADLRRVFEETMPKLPDEIGGGSMQMLTRGLAWAALSLDTAPKLSATFVAQTSDAATAKRLDDAVRASIKSALVLAKGKETEDIVTLLAKHISPVVEGDRLVARIDEAQFDKFFAEMAGPLRAAASRSQSQNNLKQIGLAMHNYLSDHGRFPADFVDKDGKSLLSWRVALLPYLEEDQLYKQFKLDEPWDSPTNKPLIAKIPKVFVPPTQKSPGGTTTYLGPFGDGYSFQPKAKGMGTRIKDIADGSSNTIMMVETADAAAVEWTRPGDWSPDVKDLTKALIGHYPEGFNAVFCDGSVRFIRKNLDAKILLAMLTIAGGEAISYAP